MKTLLTNWQSYLIAFFISLGVCLCCFVFGYIKGNQSGQAKIQAKWDKENQVREIATRLIEINLQAISDKFNNLAIKAQSTHETQKQIVYKEVIKYVQKDNTPADIVDTDWLSIYNQSIRRTNKD